MSAAGFSIGDLARETGCKNPTIRYYERIGLLPAPGRTAGNTRRYGPAHKARLAFNVFRGNASSLHARPPAIAVE